MPPTSLYVRGSSQTMVQNTIFSSVMTTTMSRKIHLLVFNHIWTRLLIGDV